MLFPRFNIAVFKTEMILKRFGVGMNFAQTEIMVVLFFNSLRIICIGRHYYLVKAWVPCQINKALFTLTLSFCNSLKRSTFDLVICHFDILNPTNAAMFLFFKACHLSLVTFSTRSHVVKHIFLLDTLLAIYF